MDYLDDAEVSPDGWWFIGDRHVCPTHSGPLQQALQKAGFSIAHDPTQQNHRRIKVTGSGDFKAFLDTLSRSDGLGGPR